MIIVNLNKKGGVGKTTNTVHIGSHLAAQGSKVLLIDCDNQCDLSWSVGTREPEELYNIEDFLTGNEDISFQVSQQNLFLLPGSSEFEASAHDRFALKKSIKELKLDEYFDYIFIDVPPAGVNAKVVTPAEMALCASDAFLCTIKADMYSVKNLNEFLGNVFKLRDNYGLNLKLIGVYFSDVNENKNLFKQFHSLIKEQAEDILLNTYVRSDAEVEKAAAESKTIFQFNPNCRAAWDYKRLTDEIVERLNKNE